MPATAGRVRMPANNRVHSSAALQTHGIWQSAIGYDPYAPNKDDSKSANQMPSNSEPEGENAYASFQGLLALARITGSNAEEPRGACKRCCRVGHLTYQCRNFLSVKDENQDNDPEGIQVQALSGLDKSRRSVGKVNGKKDLGSSPESEEEEDEESESSDSDVDSEIERIVAQRYCKKGGSKGNSLRKEKSDKDKSALDSGKRSRRGRSKKRSKKRDASDSEDEDPGRKKRRGEKRKKRHESSEEEGERQRRRRKSRKEKRGRRSNRYSDESDSDVAGDSSRRHKRKSRRAPSHSDYDVSGSDDSRVGRDKKRSGKKGRKHHREDDY